MENIQKCIDVCESDGGDSLPRDQKIKLEGCDERPLKVHHNKNIGSRQVDVQVSASEDEQPQDTATNPEFVLDVEINREWLQCLRESCHNVNKSFNTPETHGTIDLTDDADKMTETGIEFRRPIVNRPIAPTSALDVYMNIVKKVKQDPPANREILNAIHLLSSSNMTDQSRDKQAQRDTYTATNPRDVLDVDINKDWLQCLRESRRVVNKLYNTPATDGIIDLTDEADKKTVTGITFF